MEKFKMLDIVFPEEKKELNKCVDLFNELCEMGLYPNVLNYSPYDLFVKTNSEVSITTWRKFLLDPAISDWYAAERTLSLRAQVNKLISEAGTSKSTASAQTLTTLLKQINETEASDKNTVIIYNFVPLTTEERKNPLINVTKDIPNSIRNAIQIIERRTSEKD